MTKIVVIGDRMKDVDEHFITVKHHEGVPVVSSLHVDCRPGGSENVARMCRALGAEVLSLGLEPSLKKRVFIDGSLILRIDNDQSASPHRDVIGEWSRRIDGFDADVILVCDHAKGVVTQALMDMVTDTNIPVYFDPCQKSDWSMARHVDCISANRLEWSNAPRAWFGEEATLKIKRLDEDGVVWITPRGEESIPSACRRVVDTVGAGDQFLATMACCRAGGKSWRESIELANRSAGLQCERQGIVPLTWGDFDGP